MLETAGRLVVGVLCVCVCVTRGVGCGEGEGVTGNVGDNRGTLQRRPIDHLRAAGGAFHAVTVVTVRVTVIIVTVTATAAPPPQTPQAVTTLTVMPVTAIVMTDSDHHGRPEHHLGIT